MCDEERKIVKHFYCVNQLCAGHQASPLRMVCEAIINQVGLGHSLQVPNIDTYLQELLPGFCIDSGVLRDTSRLDETCQCGANHFRRKIGQSLLSNGKRALKIFLNELQGLLVRVRKFLDELRIVVDEVLRCHDASECQ